jgi:chromosome segregation ATPase
MDLEQLNKKIEWLDEERRKDKTTIAMLTDRLAALEMSIKGASQEVKAIQSETSRISAFTGKFDQIQSSISTLKVELSRSIEQVDKSRIDQNRDSEKTRQTELDSVNKSIAELKKSLDAISDIKKTLQVRQEEEFRLSRLISETDTKITEMTRGDEEYKRTLRLLEEGRRQDSKRLADLLGEVTAIRKRQDEQRGKVDITTDSTRKLEQRVTELLNAEVERRQAVNTFIEKQSVQQVERDRTWKEWQDRFGAFEKQTSIIDTQLQTLESMQRAVKRSQDSFEEITQKFDRRINEITEMSRINEDRFRQEWVGFKNDDQKRWTNYSLSQDEQSSELRRQLEKFQERIDKLEDISADLSDLLTQINEETQKRLQSLVNVTHTWAEEFSQMTKSNG